MHYSQLGAVFGLLGGVQAALQPDSIVRSQEKEVRGLLDGTLLGGTGLDKALDASCSLPLTTSLTGHTLYNG